MTDLWHVSMPYWHLVLRAGLIYLVILILLRLGGKRQIGQMGAAEFVAILLISNAVQNSMNGGDNSITAGIILAIVIVALSYLVTFLSFKSKCVETFFQGTPTLLIHKGKLLHKNLEKEMLNLTDFKTLMRKQGIHDLHEVYEAVLESDGLITLTKKSELPNLSTPPLQQ